MLMDYFVIGFTVTSTFPPVAVAAPAAVAMMVDSWLAPLLSFAGITPGGFDLVVPVPTVKFPTVSGYWIRCGGWLMPWPVRGFDPSSASRP